MPKKSTIRASKAPAAIITEHAITSKLPTVVLVPGIISSSLPISLSTVLMAARLKSASNEITKCTIIRARGNASLAHTISRKKCFRPSRGSAAGSGAGTVITKLLSRLNRHSPDSRRVRGQDRPFQRLEQWATVLVARERRPSRRLPTPGRRSAASQNSVMTLGGFLNSGSAASSTQIATPVSARLDTTHVTTQARFHARSGADECPGDGVRSMRTARLAAVRMSPIS